MQCELEQTLYIVVAVLATLAVLLFRFNIFQKDSEKEGEKKLKTVRDAESQSEGNLRSEIFKLNNEYKLNIEKIEKLEKEKLLFTESSKLLELRNKAQEIEIESSNNMINLLIRQSIFLQNGIDTLIQENTQIRGAEPGSNFSKLDDSENFHKQYINSILELEESNKSYLIKVQKHEDKIEDLEEANKILRIDIEQAKYKTSQLEGELSQAREKINLIYSLDKNQISDLDREKSDCSNKSEFRIKNLEKENRTLRTNIGQAKHEISRLKDELAQSNAKICTYSVHENQIHTLEEENKSYLVELEQFKTEIRHLEIENKVLKVDLEQAMYEISQLRGELVQAKKYDLASLIDEVKNLQVKFNKIQDKNILLSSSSTRTEEEKHRDFRSDEFKSIYGNIAGYIDYIEYVRSHLYEEFDESK